MLHPAFLPALNIPQFSRGKKFLLRNGKRYGQCFVHLPGKFRLFVLAEFYKCVACFLFHYNYFFSFQIDCCLKISPGVPDFYLTVYLPEIG